MWDGVDEDYLSVQPNGLGGIDITYGGISQAMEISVFRIDGKKNFFVSFFLNSIVFIIHSCKIQISTHTHTHIHTISLSIYPYHPLSFLVDLNFQITFYTDADHFSTYVLRVSPVAGGLVGHLPFAQFTKVASANGPVDFTNIGAIQYVNPPLLYLITSRFR